MQAYIGRVKKAVPETLQEKKAQTEACNQSISSDTSRCSTSVRIANRHIKFQRITYPENTKGDSTQQALSPIIEKWLVPQTCSLTFAFERHVITQKSKKSEI